jgi:hypothetical protein
VWDEPFDFLGYSFGVQYHFGSGRAYLAAYPSTKSVRRIKATLRRMVGSHMSWQSEENLVGDVNRRVRGWLNYFSYGTLWKTYTKLERLLQSRVRGCLCTSTGQKVAGSADTLPHTSTRLLVSLAPPECLGVVHAFGVNLVREPDAGKPHVRFDEWGRETEPCDGLRHRHPAKAVGQLLLPVANTTAPVLDSTEFVRPAKADAFRGSQP